MEREACSLLPGPSSPAKLCKQLKSNIAHIGSYLCLDSSLPTPTNTDHDSEKNPESTHTAEGSAQMVSQESSMLSVDHPRHCPSQDQPHPRILSSASVLCDLEAAAIDTSAGNGSLITAKSLLIVKIKSTSEL